ncbi:MAG: 50S ribosomal protein L2 [Sphingobacteriaceae bacterium]|nr:50S ribosomal protein L2 [Sphingobacteriaceae bacterium]
MALKKFRPLTPSQRFKIATDNSDITTNVPEKSLLTSVKNSGGRDNTGKMTIRNIGGGHKKQYRIIDFKRNKDGIEGVVASIEYDPNRTSRIALIHYKDGEKRYILAPAGLEVGKKVMSGATALPEVGNCMFLSDIPLGTVIHNIELRPGQGGAMARSAGTYAQLTARDGKYAILRMPSGEVRMILITCKATIGATSNPDHSLEISGKAGRSRWLGRRSRTRAVAMNPVDHPMGGGEGRASGGQPRSRNGIPAKGFKTRYKAKSSNQHIIKKRSK